MNALSSVSSHIVVVPAYGRKYKTAEDAVKDWEAGKDFKIVRGPYMSIRDVKNLLGTFSTIYIDLVTTMVRVE